MAFLRMRRRVKKLERNKRGEEVTREIEVAGKVFVSKKRARQYLLRLHEEHQRDRILARHGMLYRQEEQYRHIDAKHGANPRYVKTANMQTR